MLFRSQALEEQEKNLNNLQQKEKEQLEERNVLLDSAKKALQKSGKILQVKDIDSCIQEYEELLRNLKNTEDIIAAKELVNRVIQYKKDMSQKLQIKQLEVKRKLQELTEEILELTEKIHNLKRKKFSYPESVNLLQQKIEQEFLRLGRTTEPRVLCELLDITDERWRNAIEG